MATQLAANSINYSIASLSTSITSNYFTTGQYSDNYYLRSIKNTRKPRAPHKHLIAELPEGDVKVKWRKINASDYRVFVGDKLIGVVDAFNAYGGWNSYPLGVPSMYVKGFRNRKLATIHLLNVANIPYRLEEAR